MTSSAEPPIGLGSWRNNMATVTLSNATVIENPQIGTIVGFLGVTGEDATENATYRLIDPGSGRFEIKAISMEGIVNWMLVVKNSVSGDGSSLFDFENDALNSFTFKIAATGDLIDNIIATTTFTVSVTDNTAPIDIFLSNNSVVENAQTGTVIDSLWTFDPDDDDTFTYTLTDDAGGRFDIVDGNLVVKDGSLLDYEAAKSHQIMIEVKDSDGNVFTKALTINVSDAVDIRNGIAANDQPLGGVRAGLSGKDALYGSADDDIINGLGGNDKLYGLAGNDTLNGGAGKDKLYGGDGQDVFVFDAPVKKGHFDHIEDFKASDDTIQISLSALKAFKVKGAKTSDVTSKKGSDGEGKPDDKGGKKTVGFDKIFTKGQKLQKKFFDIGTKPDDATARTITFIITRRAASFT